MRRRLHTTVTALGGGGGRGGGGAMAVKCVAVFFRANHGTRATEALLSAGFKFVVGLSGWDIVGKLKKTQKRLSEQKPIELDYSPFAIQPVQIPLCSRIKLVNEEATEF